MKRIEVVKLVAIVKALCPSQKFEEITPDVWALVLTDLSFTEAQAAVQKIYRTQGDDNQWIRSIEADDIIRQVKRDRSGRDKVNCSICGRTRSQCENAYAFEIRCGLPDPHEFKSADEAVLNKARHQLESAIPGQHVPERRVPWLPEDLAAQVAARQQELIP